MGKVERGWFKPGVRRLRLDKCEVGEVEFGGDLTGHGNHAGLVVDADRLTGDGYAIAKEVHDPDRAAPDVDGSPASLNPHLVEQPGRLVGEALRLPDETLPLGFAGPEHIPGRRTIAVMTS